MTKFGDRVYQMGGIPVGLEVLQPVDIRYVYNSTSGAIYKELSKRYDHNKLHATLALAEAATTAGQNEIVFVTPNENHELSASVTWDNNDTHLIGMTLNKYQPHADIWMAAGSGFSPMITVSARGCYFANLTFRHGASTGNAGDLTCMKISGRYNTFENVYFYGPMYAEQDNTSYVGVQVTGHNNYFKGCKFGSTGLARDQVNYSLEVAGSENVFEDCVFATLLDGTSPRFLHMNNAADDRRYTYFKNCLFVVHYSAMADQMVYALNAHAGGTMNVIFDSRCMFVGVDYISDSDDDQWVWIATPGDTAATAASLLAVRNLGT